MRITKMLATAAVAAVVAGGASAATMIGDPGSSAIISTFDIGVGDAFTVGQSLAPGARATFAFTVTEALVIENIAFSGTGFAGGRDLSQAEVGFGTTNPEIPPVSAEFMEMFPISAGGSGAVGSSLTLPGGTFAAGDTFFISFLNGSDLGAVSLTASFSTAAIPVPAAGLMLLGALAAGGVVARRKKNDA